MGFSVRNGPGELSSNPACISYNDNHYTMVASTVFYVRSLLSSFWCHELEIIIMIIDQNLKNIKSVKKNSNIMMHLSSLSFQNIVY